jgi:hypothetical protein
MHTLTPTHSDLRYGVQAQTVGCNFPKVRHPRFQNRFAGVVCVRCPPSPPPPVKL